MKRKEKEKKEKIVDEIYVAESIIHSPTYGRLNYFPEVKHRFVSIF